MDNSKARWFYLAGVYVLVFGLLAAALAYLTAGDGRSDAVGYEVAGEEVYVVTAAESKRYRHDMEVFGGKAAILLDDFNRWFSGLWQGKHLAYTLALLTLGIALVCFWIADRLAPGDEERHD